MSGVCALVLTVLILSLYPVSARAGTDAFTGGRAALEDNLYELAQKQLEQCLSDPTPLSPTEFREAGALLARALHAQGKYEDILNDLGPDLRFVKKSTDTDAFVFWRAMALFELGRYDESLAETAAFSTRYADSEYRPRVIRLNAWCRLKKGDTEGALAGLADFDRRYGDHVEAADNLAEWGALLVSLNRRAEARDVLTRLVTRPLTQAAVQEGYLRLGDLLMETGDWSRASNVLVALADQPEAAPDLRATAWYRLADIQEAQSNLVAAATNLQWGIKQAASGEIKRRGTLSLGLVRLSQGQVEEALPLLREAIAAAPTDPQAERAQLRLAQYFLGQGLHQEAVEEFQRYVETFTNSLGRATAYEGKGWSLTALARYAEAATAFAKAGSLYTDPGRQADCLLKEGDAHFANAQYKLAATNYEALLQQYPASANVPNALIQLAESLIRSGDVEAAEKRFQELSARFPESAFSEEAMLRSAELKATKRQWPEAIDGFNQVMERYPKGAFRAQALFGRGLIHYQVLRFAEALKDFERVMTDFPQSDVIEEAFYRRAMSLYWVGRDGEALATCRAFLNGYPQSRWAAPALFWIGTYHFNHGEFEAAEKVFLQYVAQYPRQEGADVALLRAGLAAARRNEFVSSVEILARLVKEYPESRKLADARFAQADAMSQLAKYSAAILIFDEIILKYPDSPLVPAAWGRKGDCQFTLGSDDPRRYEESMASYRVVANSATAPLDQVMQAEYKIGRSLEKLGRTDEAFEQYYVAVMLRFLEDRQKGVRHNEGAKVWFARAAFGAATIAEARKDREQAVRILERVVEAGVPAGAEAAERIRQLRPESK